MLLKSSCSCINLAPSNYSLRGTSAKRATGTHLPLPHDIHPLCTHQPWRDRTTHARPHLLNIRWDTGFLVVDLRGRGGNVQIPVVHRAAATGTMQLHVSAFVLLRLLMGVGERHDACMQRQQACRRTAVRKLVQGRNTCSRALIWKNTSARYASS